MAQAFIGKKPHLLQDADKQFQQLQQAKVMAMEIPAMLYDTQNNWEIDFGLERGLCALLIGKVDECRTWLGLDSEESQYRNPAIVEFVLENSNRDDNDDLPGLCKLLETWLAGVVFPRFRDTKDNNFKLGDYYDDPMVLSYLERVEVVQGSPLAAAAAMARIGAEHVKASAMQALQKVFPSRYADRNSAEPKDVQETVFSVDHVGNNVSHDGKPAVFIAEAERPSENFETIDYAIPAGVSKSSADAITVEMSVANMLKEASVKILAAGVAIGMISLFSQKYLPLKSSSSFQRKDMASSMESDIATIGMIKLCSYHISSFLKVSMFVSLEHSSH